MHRAMTANKLNSNTVVTRKSDIHNTKVSNFQEVRLFIAMGEIKQWTQEIELMEEAGS